MKDNIVIIGGGESVFEGVVKIGLKELLKDRFVISCNTAFLDFDSTGICILDEILISNYADKLNKQENIITAKHSNAERYLKEFYIAESFSSKLGLTGIFALSLINKLFKNANIFLLGFDFDNSQYHTRNTDLKKIIVKNNDVTSKVSQNNKRNVYDLSEMEIRTIFDDIIIANNIYNVNTFSKIPNYLKINWQQFYTFLPKKNGKTQQYFRDYFKIKLQTAQIQNIY